MKGNHLMKCLVNQKKNHRNTGRFENDKREQKNTTGTFDEKKTFFLHEFRKRKITEKKK
jgi:hypothetical protein